MTDTEPRAKNVQEDEPDAWATVTVGVAGTILVVAVVVFVQGLYESARRREFERKVVSEAPQELRQLRVTQLERLVAVAWVDKSKEIVTIPIERAMEAVVRDLGGAADSARVPGGERR